MCRLTRAFFLDDASHVPADITQQHGSLLIFKANLCNNMRKHSSKCADIKFTGTVSTLDMTDYSCTFKLFIESFIIICFIFTCTVKPVLSGHSKIDKTKI